MTSPSTKWYIDVCQDESWVAHYIHKIQFEFAVLHGWRPLTLCGITLSLPIRDFKDKPICAACKEKWDQLPQ